MADEDEILVPWGMRFDGYLYESETKFSSAHFEQQFWKTGSLLFAQPLEALTVFHFLQRYLYKFGGEVHDRDAPEWRLFRALFLHTARFEVPERYRGSDLWYPEWYRRWLSECAPHVEQHLAIVSEIHRRTEYCVRAEVNMDVQALSNS